MPIQEVRASGREYLALATELLQRARLADAEAGLWEAADLQWWWRTPRLSDSIDQLSAVYHHRGLPPARRDPLAHQPFDLPTPKRGL